ncbi:RNA polymerase sigma-70 factor [Nocardioides sp. Bht2]|uniref:RNA polymerase sigma-70 factor n=1 Tax=Nocardioides sp. Bht2 TaxID=3392297 RepID=UPI0039B6561E
MTGTDPFLTHRSLLFTVAYEMLGSATDAEDVVQETWLRWSEVDPDGVRDPRAYLVRITTRQALNRLRTVTRQRETYVGPWLPEPLITRGDVADDVALADSVSFAMLVVLESLSPLERAVFCLREVFGFDYDEIATTLDRTPAAVRQLASRARAHVSERRPRTTVSRSEHEEVARRFSRAIESGEIEQLIQALAPDVVLYSDGGGKVKAALRPIHGQDKVWRFLLGVWPAGAEFEAVEVNGWPGFQMTLDGRVDLIATFRVEGGLVTELYVQRNPDKLARSQN